MPAIGKHLEKREIRCNFVADIIVFCNNAKKVETNNAHNARHRWTICLLVIASVLIAPDSKAQGGSSVYTFLDLPMSARLNALGGSNVSLRENEISYALCNPALLNANTDKVLQLNYAYYLQGINVGSVLYGHNYKDNRFAAAVHYLDYGDFRYADEYGNLTGGTFSARDVCINLMYARQLGPLFSVGATLKPIYSHYEAYGSFALAADVGGHFQTRDSAFQLGISLQNIGWQLKGFYTEESKQHREPLPLNLQLGLNYRFKHAPIRLSMTIHNMQRWNLDTQLTNTKTEPSLIGNAEADNNSVKWYDMMFRHTIFALDIVPKSNRFYLTLSYNHRRRMEMHIKDQRSLAGFALGGGVRIYKFQVGFAFSQYLKGGYIYQFTLSTDINDFLK